MAELLTDMLKVGPLATYVGLLLMIRFVYRVTIFIALLVSATLRACRRISVCQSRYLCIRVGPEDDLLQMHRTQRRIVLEHREQTSRHLRLSGRLAAYQGTLVAFQGF
jgi:hypothetical protein